MKAYQYQVGHVGCFTLKEAKRIQSESPSHPIILKSESGFDRDGKFFIDWIPVHKTKS